MSDTPIIIEEKVLDVITKKRNRKKYKTKSIVIIASLVILWGCLFYAGYWFANQINNKNMTYIDSKIEEEVNALQPKIDAVYEEVININEELLKINQELAITSDLLYGTDTNKLILQQRIDELNSQLNELQASIERLRDATTN